MPTSVFSTLMNSPVEVFTLLACPSCRFDANSQFTSATNLAVAVMFVALVAVFGGIGGFVWRLARFQRNAPPFGEAGPLQGGTGAGANDTMF